MRQTVFLARVRSVFTKRPAYVAVGVLLMIAVIVYGSTRMLGGSPDSGPVAFFDMVLILALWTVVRHWWDKKN